MAQQDVTPVQPALPNVGILLRDLDTEAIAVEESGIDVSLQIMEQILSAETEEDLWRAQNASTISGQEFVDRPFLMKSSQIDWKRSRENYIAQGGFPFYFLARVLDLGTNEEVVVNCGGKTVVAMVRKLQKLGAFDQYENGRPLMLKSNGGTESGNEYLTIHPAIVAPATNGKK